MKPANWYKFTVDDDLFIIEFTTPDISTKEEYEVGKVIMLDETLYEDPGWSQVIFHLSDKVWVTREMLYDLAVEINKLRPQNDIDWRKTFFPVELSRQTEKHLSGKYPEPIVKADDPNSVDTDKMLDKLMDDIAFKVNLSDEQRADIENTVETELKSRGIN